MRFDVGEKFGYFQTTIEFALNHEGLMKKLLEYLRKTVEEKEYVK